MVNINRVSIQDNATKTKSSNFLLKAIILNFLTYVNLYIIEKFI